QFTCHYRALPSFPTRRSSDLMEYLFQSIVGATLHAEVVNDKQRIAAKAGNILIPACKAGREVAQDNGEVRHIYGDFFLHKGVCRSEEHTSELQSRFDLVCRLL